MKIKRLVSALAAGLVLAAGSTTASASLINIGGVVFDPDSIFDFSTNGNMYEYVVSPSSTEAHGFGRINEVNASTSFCPTCELTYTFGGFTLTNGADPAHLLFDGGWVNFYVQNTSAAGYTAFNPTAAGGNAGDGTLWLSLAGHTDTRAGFAGPGTLFGKIDSGTLGTGTERGQGGGLLDVTGGLAAGNINTNSVADSNGGFADLNYTSTFLPTTAAAIAAGAPPLTGTATFTGNSIPEPATLLLLGVGLLGLGIGGKKKQRNV